MSDPTGYRESPDTADGPTDENLVDGTTGHNQPDPGERDTTTLTTDDAAQQENGVERPGNAPD
jgi:hypothetical protein